MRLLTDLGNLTIVLRIFFSLSDWLVKASKQFHAVLLLALAKQAFKLSFKHFQNIIKQILNLVLTEYEELLRPWFVLSASAFGFGR